MTLAADIAKLGSYNSTDITNAVAQALAGLRLPYGGALAENDNEAWDEIVKYYAVYLLDRLHLQRKSLTDSSVTVPPLWSKDIQKMIDMLEIEADTQGDPAGAIVAISSTPSENWYSPSTSRGTEI